MTTDKLYDRIYRYCYMKTGHPQTAEDITQETFLRFLQVYDFEECAKRSAYLYTIARNLCMDHYRSKKREEPRISEEPWTEDGSESRAVRMALEQAMEHLKEDDRELLFLKYTDQVPVGEIAKLMGVSRFTVRRREKQALEQLKQYLDRRDFYE